MENTYKPEGTGVGFRHPYYSKKALQQAAKNEEILEGIATMCDGEYRLHVDLGCMQGVIPKEEATDTPPGEPTKDIAVITRVGKSVSFCVTGFFRGADGVEYASLSRRAAQKKCRVNYVGHLTPGDIIPAKVTHTEQFGAFVDIGCGIVSLLPIDAISVSRISHPNDRLFCGMEIPVVIRRIDGITGRIFVSLKELFGTWEENAALFSPGETVTGVVRSIEEYGVFVELTPNLSGLAEKRDGISVGQSAAVYVKSLIPQRMKVKLALVDSYRTETVPRAPRFFLSQGHIDTWVYSPSCADRLIMTDFGQNQESP